MWQCQKIEARISLLQSKLTCENNTCHFETDVFVATLMVCLPNAFVTFTPGVSALPVGASLGTNAAVFAGKGPTAARPAFGSTGNFGAVLGVPNDGEYIVNFAASSIFSFVLGSLDTYNT